jgi:hypothetical protein
MASVNETNELVEYPKLVRGGFHKSWVHGVKRKAHPNMGENVIS